MVVLMLKKLYFEIMPVLLNIIITKVQ